jgi:HPt (histidine-containing phosphotransfer) domain-containing protein
MTHGDKQAEEPLPHQGQRRPDRSDTWMQLTEDYLRDLLRQLDELTGLLEADDHVGIRHFAHRAKGTSGTYGLALISEQFARLEQAAESHPREHVPGLLVAIRQLIEAETEKLRPWAAPSGRGENGAGNG